MRRRAERRATTLDGDLDQLPASSALWYGAPDDARDDVHGRLRHAIATVLTDKQREVVEQFYFEGRSQGEIARRLGITQQVVQKRLFGAPRAGKLVGGAVQRLRVALSPAEAP